MKPLHTATAVALATALLAGCGQHALAPIPNGGTSNIQSASSTAGTIQQIPRLTPFYTYLTPIIDYSTLEAQRNAGTTIPFFTSTIASPLDHKTYTFRIVGSNPHTSLTTTNVSVVPIVLIVKFPDGRVWDPTKPGCGDTVSVENRFLNGPDFVNVPFKSNGISVGTTQYGDADQRAQFWSLVKGSSYHVLLKMAKAPIVLTESLSAGAAEGSITCNGKAEKLGAVEISTWQNLLQTIAKAHTTSNQVPLFLTYNFVQYITTTSNCCVIGFHSAFTNGGTEVYATAGYIQPGVFTGLQDITAYTHEIGELLNDPFINNATPAWGHVGQVTGCQANLETGDPLSGKDFAVSAGGFTYHPQELAFFDWFYRTPSEGTSAKYSYNGTFTKPQPKICT